MNLELSGKLQNLLQENKIAECIEIAENELEKQPKTNFQKIIGRKELLKQVKKLNKWIGKFYKSANKKIYLKSLCAEMNRIAMNPDNWYLDIFAYDNYGGAQNFDWLEEWQHENPDRDNFSIKGFEDIQKAYKKFREENKSQNETLSISAELCELLIILRLFELFDAARNLAIEKEKKWIKVPVIVKADGNELIYELK
jgi:hypothetical protein